MNEEEPWFQVPIYFGHLMVGYAPLVFFLPINSSRVNSMQVPISNNSGPGRSLTLIDIEMPQ